MVPHNWNYYIIFQFSKKNGGYLLSTAIETTISGDSAKCSQFGQQYFYLLKPIALHLTDINLLILMKLSTTKE